MSSHFCHDSKRRKYKNAVSEECEDSDSNYDDGSDSEAEEALEVREENTDTKGGVDTVDKMCDTYNYARRSNQWPIVIYYSLINVAGIFFL